MSILRVVGNGNLIEQTLAVGGAAKQLPALALASPSGTAFTPIGPGKPLTVEIAHVYTGKYPATIFGSSPMLVTSAVKNMDVTGASSEAVNFLINKVGKRSDFVAPPSDKAGYGSGLLCPRRNCGQYDSHVQSCFRKFPRFGVRGN